MLASWRQHRFQIDVICGKDILEYGFLKEDQYFEGSWIEGASKHHLKKLRMKSKGRRLGIDV